MIAYAEVINTLLLSPVVKKSNTPVIKITALTVVRKSTTAKEIKEPDESVIPFHKYNMPPQPQGYIKCPLHDFL